LEEMGYKHLAGTFVVAARSNRRPTV